LTSNRLFFTLHTRSTGGWFQLKHVNIHQPSEHRIDGKAADVEMQFLHQGFDNQFLTLSGRNESVRVGAEEREIEKGTCFSSLSESMVDILMEIKDHQAPIYFASFRVLLNSF
jgi:hypothetical protein